VQAELRRQDADVAALRELQASGEGLGGLDALRGRADADAAHLFV
jgi:hypothetical protein